MSEATTVDNGRSMVVYPNPAKNKITLLFGTETVSQKDVLLVDISGKQIIPEFTGKASGNSLELDISGLKFGVYFLNIRNERTNKFFRIIKL